MTKKKDTQPELLMETPAIVTPAELGAEAERLVLIEDTPDVVRMDLRKFNKTQQKIDAAVRTVTGVTIIESQAGADKMMRDLKELDGVGKVVEAKRKELGDPYRKEWERVNGYVKELVKDVEPAIKGGKALILGYHKAEEAKAIVKRTEARHAFLLEQGMFFHAEGNDKIKIPHFTDGISDHFILHYDMKEATDLLWNEMLIRLSKAREDHKNTQLVSLEKEKEGADFFGDEEVAAVVQGKIDEVVAAPRPVGSYGGFSSSAPATKGLTKRWTYELTDISLVPREYLQLDEKKVKEAIAGGIRSIAGIRIYQDESISLR